MNARTMKVKAIVLVVAGVFAGWMAGTARADFVLEGTEHLNVGNSYNNGQTTNIGILYNQSTADVDWGGSISSAYVNDEASLRVLEYPSFWNFYDPSSGHGTSVEHLYAYDTSSVAVSGGSVNYLYAYNTSTVAVSGGAAWANPCLVNYLYAYDSSTADISGGSVSYLYAYSTADISGGSVSRLYAYNTGTADISGGSVNYLYAYNTSTVTLHGYDFRATAGLTLDGDKVLGTGILTGRWSPDGTLWAITISAHNSGATILAIPEPATLSLLALGGLALLRRRRAR